MLEFGICGHRILFLWAYCFFVLEFYFFGDFGYSVRIWFGGHIGYSVRFIFLEHTGYRVRIIFQ